MFPLALNNKCSLKSRPLDYPDLSKIDQYPRLHIDRIYLYDNDGYDVIYKGYSVQENKKDPVIYNVTPVRIKDRNLSYVRYNGPGHYFPMPVIKVNVPDGIYLVPKYAGSMILNTTIVNYVNGLREGNAIIQNNEGDNYTEIYKNGFLVNQIKKDTMGYTTVSNYRNGLYHGKFEILDDEDKITFEANYVDGFLQGPFIDHKAQFEDSPSIIIGNFTKGTDITHQKWNLSYYRPTWFAGSLYYYGLWTQVYTNNDVYTRRAGKTRAQFNYDDMGILHGVSYVTFDNQKECQDRYPNDQCVIINHSVSPNKDTNEQIRYGVIRYYLHGKQVTKEQFNEYFDRLYTLISDQLPTVLADMVYDYTIDPRTTEDPIIG